MKYINVIWEANMKRVSDLTELKELRNKLKDQLGIRHDAPDNIQVVVSMGTCGIAAGAPEVLKAITKEVGRLNLQNVTVAHKGCNENCENAPVLEVIVPGKESVFYDKIDTAKALKVISDHVVGGTPVKELMRA